MMRKSVTNSLAPMQIILNEQNCMPLTFRHKFQFLIFHFWFVVFSTHTKSYVPDTTYVIISILMSYVTSYGGEFCQEIAILVKCYILNRFYMVHIPWLTILPSFDTNPIIWWFREICVNVVKTHFKRSPNECILFPRN